MKEGKTDSKKAAAKKSSTQSEPPESTKSASATDKASAAKKRSAGAESAKSDSKATRETDAPLAAPAARTPVIDEQPRLPATHGKVNVFGGPKDRGIKPDDKLALPTGPHGVYERVRTLSPKSFYCAMRWNYHVEHMSPEEVKRWWANKKLLLTNTNNGKAVVVRAVDYGPHENTGLDVGVSPGAAEALGVEIGDEVDIALADPKSALGPTK
jgi:pyruvate/2-oxoglutarate dehydrogenase complex dihydrolipoamide acyltransferase (E2) component